VSGKETEIEFERLIREHQLLIHRVCRLYVFTEVDRQDLFQEIIIIL
jgi:RNA polymerase sigma-70 factor (ECF subfamily)